MSELEEISGLGMLLEPITESSPVGNDPRYDDKFLKLKFEMEKSNIDFAQLKQLATHILRYTAKDLRVMGCLMLALIHEHGLNGLCSAMHLMAHMIETYWEDIHPYRAAARISAIEYLGHPRMQAAISCVQPKTQAQLNALEKAHHHLQQALLNVIGEKALSILSQAFRGIVLSNQHSFVHKSPSHQRAKVSESLYTNNTIDWEKLISPQEEPTRESAPFWATNKSNFLDEGYHSSIKTKKTDKPKNNNVNNDKQGFSLPVALKAEIEQILTVPATSQKEKFMQTMLMAEMSISYGSYQFAVDCLEWLVEKIEHYKLEEWEPEFPLRVYHLLYNLKLQSVEFQSKLTIQTIRQKLLQLDVNFLLEEVYSKC